jgi:hypothetical protein
MMTRPRHRFRRSAPFDPRGGSVKLYGYCVDGAETQPSTIGHGGMA